MVGSFQLFEQRGDLSVMAIQHLAHTQRKGLDNKWLYCLRLVGSAESAAEQPIDSPFEGVARAPHLLLHQHGNVIVNGKSGSHIMMLQLEAS